MEFIKENHYLFLSSKRKCIKLFSLKNWEPPNIVDYLISLHQVLEIGLNSFFRELILLQPLNGLDKTTIVENLDKVSFIDKTRLFFSLPLFDFEGKTKEAISYQSAIGKLKNFTEIRNKLLHGHMVGQITYEDGRTSTTKTSKLISEITLNNQMESFRYIMEAVGFYFDHLKTTLTKNGKEDIKQFYLDTSFLDKIALELPGMTY